MAETVQEDVVRALLDVWNKHFIDKDNAEVTLNAFVDRVLRKPVTSDDSGTWVLGAPGMFSVGDSIRVLSDAFQGKEGDVHNRRVGKIVGIRHGDIIVKYTDGKDPQLDSVHFKPTSLEKRIA